MCPARELQFSDKLKKWDRQHQVSAKMDAFFKKAQASTNSFQEGVRDQVLYWQRMRRLREEQQQVGPPHHPPG
jgi:hypothetical protein